MSSQRESIDDLENVMLADKDSFDLEYLLVGDIRILLTERFDWRSRNTLLLLLNRLTTNLPKVLELSSKETYMAPVLERRPNLSQKVDDMYQANLDCLAVLNLVRDRIQKDLCIESISDELELLLKNWIRSFAALRHQERRILQEAFVVDFGGEA